MYIALIGRDREVKDITLLFVAAIVLTVLDTASFGVGDNHEELNKTRCVIGK